MRYLKIITPILFLFFLSTTNAQSKEISVGSTQKGLTPVENRYAFIVGIDKYQDPKVENFTSCRIDAVEFKSYLRSNKGWNMKSDHITQLLDVSKDSIVNSLTRFLNGIAKPETATVYFYYSGHGVRGSIVPADYFKDEPEKLISYDYIKEEIDKRNVQSKVFILDACYSGSIIKMKGGDDFDSNYARFIQDDTPDSNQVTFTATSRNRTTPAGKNLSVFTYHLLQVLDNKAADLDDNNILSSGELFVALEKRLNTSNPPQFAGSRNFPMASFNTIENPSLINDSDGDGIINSIDQCPNKKGTLENNGCPKPIEETSWRDKYDEIGEFITAWNNKLTYVKKDDKFGYVDQKGALIIDLVYDDAYNFDQHIYNHAKVKQNGKWFLIDSEGVFYRYCSQPDVNSRLEKKYTFVSSFNDGIAFVSKDRKIGFVNEKGEEIIDLIYDEVYYLVRLGKQSFFKNDEIKVKQNGKWFWINKKGECIKDCSSSNPNQWYLKGKDFYDQENYENAFIWFKKAAELDHTKAQDALGEMYDNFKGVSQDFLKALFWYGKAAKKGNVHSQIRLASFYEMGEVYYKSGIPQDLSLAFYWYKKCAEQGYGFCQGNLGQMYQNGKGVTKNLSESDYWFKKACANGYELYCD